MFLLHITYKELKTIPAVTYGINIAKNLEQFHFDLTYVAVQW